jgi:hypothetical protein
MLFEFIGQYRLQRYIEIVDVTKEQGVTDRQSRSIPSIE